MSGIVTSKIRKPAFRFAVHPWTAMVVFIIAAWVVLLGFALLRNAAGLFSPGSALLLMIVVAAPLGFRIPRTKRSLHQHVDDMRRRASGSSVWLWARALFAYYLDYFDAIRLTRVRPIMSLVLLGLTCWALNALCQVAGSVVFRLWQQLPLTPSFLLDTIDITKQLPPRSMSVFTSFGSVFEEILWRGIFLSLFLYHFSQRKAIAMSALGFSLMHAINVLNGGPLIGVVGQIGWAFILGLWYGYATVKTDSLLPAMLVHWLANAFVYAFTSYLQAWAPPAQYTLYCFIFGFGVLPTILMLLWTRFYTSRWLQGRG